ncbi:MAG: regulatory protein RecX [Bacteroidota bacterium]
MPKELGYSEARQKISKFCSFRERSPKEVEDKLTGWGLEKDEITRLIKELSDMNFIHEQRFANAFCHDKFEFNSWGKQKIKNSIYGHKLPDEVVEHALKMIEEERYLARIKELFNKKWQLTKEDDLLKKKRKVFSFLTGKGFEPDLIWKTIETGTNR